MAKKARAVAGRKPDKERIFREIVAGAIALDLKCGHLKWSVARLARRSGVSRPLIYYYFGKSKIRILLEATKIFGGELAGFTERKTNFWETGRIDLALAESRKLLQEIPGVAAWYYLQRDGETEVGESIRKIEADHVKKIQKYLPEAGEAGARAIFALFFGVSFSPIAGPETPAKAVELVLKGLGKA
ncbi:MAG: TetR/AcrR family transcriptional regulator [Bdellovibrionales bacterium]|nr:TetR/AcrR family transcriptional regulator [Bdellovibrionales bacterium]